VGEQQDDARAHQEAAQEREHDLPRRVAIAERVERVVTCQPIGGRGVDERAFYEARELIPKIFPKRARDGHDERSSLKKPSSLV
jgi:hypothetical protein